MASGSNSLSLARFAFNIYGSLSNTEKPQRQYEPQRFLSPSSKSFVYACDREITAISQFTHPLGRLNSSFFDASTFVPSLHVVLGGKNFLKLLVLNRDQSGLLADLNLVDPNPTQRLQLIPKLFNVNTIKCNADLIACGLTNGNVHIFQVAGNGKSKLAYRLDDHKRVINSLDFVEMEQLLFSGSQDGSVRLWDLRMYSPKPAIKLLASQHSDPVRSCQYSPFLKVRGKLNVLSVHDSGSLCKFDLRYPSSSNMHSALPERKWTFHTGPALSLHIHPEQEYVLTGGRDRKICLWNYSDSLASAKSPELIMNTYGPVMKVRWNNTPNAESPPSFPGNTNDEIDGRSMSLYNYDFACLYLNDDPTVTVFNLARRYVPKEIITTNTRKPVQNFIWAKGLSGERRLWTISKANNFVSYDLDSPNDHMSNILRTQENLPVVASAWSEGYANMAFVNQNTEDYDKLQLEQGSPSLEDGPVVDEYRADDEKYHAPKPSKNYSESMNVFSRSFLPLTSTSHPGATSGVSPKEKSYSNRHSSVFSSGLKSPSPISFHRPSVTEFSAVMSPVRPSLKNTPSQSTIDSNGLSGIYIQPLSHGLPSSKKNWNVITPSVIDVSLPIPLADDSTFISLASNYLINIPDGFSLSFVCNVNAQVAESVGRVRDSQTWSLLSAVLEQEAPVINAPIAVPALPTIGLNVEDNSSNPNDDIKSLCSDLDNFVASYNSNSTLTTNYGGGPKSNPSTTSMTKALLSSSKQSSHIGDLVPPLRKQSKVSSVASHTQIRNDLLGLSANEKNSVHLKTSEKAPTLFIGEAVEGENGNSSDVPTRDDKESAIEEEEPQANEEVTASTIVKHKSQSDLNSVVPETSQSLTNPFAAEPKFVSPDFMGEDLSPQSRARRPYMHRGFSFTTPSNFQKIPVLANLVSDRSSYAHNQAGASPGLLGNPVSFENNQLQRRRLLNQNRMYHYLTNHSNSSVGSLPVPYVDGFNPLKEDKPAAAETTTPVVLDRVDESSIKSKDPVASELTKAINQVNLHSQTAETRKPWHSLNLLSKALDFAIDEGDLVTAATFIMLFADFYAGEFYHSVLSEDRSLECLGAYVEALRRKELYNISVQIVKDAPQELKYRLNLYACKETDMKFYCCWCQKLLVNEQSKIKFGATSENYGYWYCDECSKKQLNCVYCNEPCKGLTVVVDLVCGHRGHFGCLKEWFIEDKNTACPGGCEK